MACILVTPGGGAKGVVTFTTQERDHLILADRRLVEAIGSLKEQWVVGLHHNWHDFNFRYNPLFDFSMAGEEDLREVNRTPFRLIPMDACNFSPECFRPGATEKFWDVLYISRPVFFKRLSGFFSTIRSLYDEGHGYRVLLVTSKDPEGREPERSLMHALEDEYERLFSARERERFSWWRLQFNFPFPLDMETLSHLYRSSKVFVHAAEFERRCRVAAYAWATGIPVVATAHVGSLLPVPLRRPPYFYEVPFRGRWDVRRKMGWTWSRLFPKQVVRAVETRPLQDADVDALRAQVGASETPAKLGLELRRVLGDCGVAADPALSNFKQLDIRLGRHHTWDGGLNRVEQPLPQFVGLLRDRPDFVRDVLAASQDPELTLARATWHGPGGNGTKPYRTGSARDLFRRAIHPRKEMLASG